MIYAYIIFVCFCFYGALWWISNRLKVNKYLIFFLFSVKIVACIVFLRVYIPDQESEMKSSDAHAYFFEGKVLNSVWEESPSDYLKLLTGIGQTEELENKYLEEEVFHWSHQNKTYNDNENIIRLNSLIHFYSNNSPLIHAVTFSFFSLIGFILMALFIHEFSGISYQLILLVLVLLPSSLFWTSSILKEPLAVLAIGFSLSFFINFRKSIKYFLTCIGIVLMLLFKPYILLFLLPGILVASIFHFVKIKNILFPVSLFLLGIIIVFTIPKSREYIVYKTSKQQYDFDNISRGGIYFSHEGSVKRILPKDYSKVHFDKDSVKIGENLDVNIVDYNLRMSPESETISVSESRFAIVNMFEGAKSYVKLNQFDSVKGMFLEFPRSIYNGFIRPFPWNPGRFNLIAFLETLFLMGLMLGALFGRKKLTKPQKTIVFLALSFFIILTYLTGLTTSSFGTIVRYRIPAHWAWVVVVFILMGGRKQVNSFRIWVKNDNNLV